MPDNKTSTVAPGADLQLTFHAKDLDGKEDKVENIYPFWETDKPHVAQLQVSEDGYKCSVHISDGAIIGTQVTVQAKLTLADGTDLNTGLFPILIGAPGFKPTAATITQD